MKRVWWIPVLASAVLLLIAVPVFSGTFIAAIQSDGTPPAGAFGLETFAEQVVFDDALYAHSGGAACASGRGIVENPF